MKHTSDSENLKDEKALRREKKKRPRMKQRSRALKQKTARGILRIHKVTKRR